MSVTIDGTKGTTTPGLYSNSTFTGTYADGLVADYTTGLGRISVGTADGVAFYNGGVATTELMRIDSSGNVGIGTSSPAYALHAQRGAGVASYIGAAGNNNDLTTSGLIFGQDTSGLSRIFQFGANPMTFWTNGSERMRIDSSGNLLVGQTSGSSRLVVQGTSGSASCDVGVGANGNNAISFRNVSNTYVGSITVNASTTAFNTSSDYRLKENITPMTGALSVVQQLKPCTYTWKATGENSQGFIAHELAEVVPDAVTGEKDAVDVDGNPVYQGIDTSFLVATLTAAIQELKAELDAAKADIAALKAPQ